jgi:hypothetical protein
MGEDKDYSLAVIAEVAQLMSLARVNEIKSYTGLCDEINYLIVSDFHSLVNILYRMDVSETRIAAALAGFPGTDAAQIIAGLMLERQLQKIKTRKQFNSNEDISGEERW